MPAEAEWGEPGFYLIAIVISTSVPGQESPLQHPWQMGPHPLPPTSRDRELITSHKNPQCDVISRWHEP